MHERPSCSDVVDKRSAFKTETVFLLEQAFIANAYPSRAEKECLAARMGMEYKQVNTWTGAF
ncbi:hypothetical protein EUX98_g760 [Antrodiella citrinella]|uniref:Homeobox domain-containing protein n=1 Tax=Antrodiella citrinella TaxID=2447956 RepID=A0A4S4N384_9APHY|nr:hypothetical protein EUX98_g760 [Antrodiella citrinella]